MGDTAPRVSSGGERSRRSRRERVSSIASCVGRFVEIPGMRGPYSEDTDYEQRSRGRDMQAIDWTATRLRREDYRAERLRTYQNYRSMSGGSDKETGADVIEARACGRFFDFARNARAARSSIMHFQLRHLVHALSSTEVLYVCDDRVDRLETPTSSVSVAMDLSGRVLGAGVPVLESVQVTSMATKGRLVAAGGLAGEVVVRHLDRPGLLIAKKASPSGEGQGITNGIVLAESASGAPVALLSSNDSYLRLMDAMTGAIASSHLLPWPVNYAAPCPQDPALACTVGDGTSAVLLDTKCGGRVATLDGHRDHCFAVAWHPGGRLVATGSQDTTARVWDVRQPRCALGVLKGRIGAVRSLHFSPDGSYLAVAEPADFVHVYDVNAGLVTQQEIDMFGEIAGMSFSPCGESLFIGLSEPMFGGMLEFQRHCGRFDPWGG